MRQYGTGHIEPRGPGTWRLRYRVGGKRHSVMTSGTRMEAQRKLREILSAADAGEVATPARVTLARWVDQWLLLLRRGEANGVRRRGLVSPRTSERYHELLTSYVLPQLGDVPLQKITPSAIDAIYVGLEATLSPTTIRHAHVALRSALATACRKGLLAKNPADNADPPRPVESDVGMALDVADAKRLLAGFVGSVYYPIVMTALQTGLRLSELLALQWRDLDPVAMTLKVERAIEVTREFGRVLKEPKNKRSQRTIVVDPSLVAMLQTERERHLRLRAGVPDGTKVSLRAIKLPANALMFPAPPADGLFDFTKLRNGKTVTHEVRDRFRRLGFPKLRFHDLRATHGTTLLDAGVPVHTVAARLGHSPEVLLRLYAKRTRKADTSTNSVLADFAKGLL